MVVLIEYEMGGVLTVKIARAILKLGGLYISGFIQLIVYALLGENITVLGSHQDFYERIS